MLTLLPKPDQAGPTTLHTNKESVSLGGSAKRVKKTKKVTRNRETGRQKEETRANPLKRVLRLPDAELYPTKLHLVDHSLKRAQNLVTEGGQFRKRRLFRTRTRRLSTLRVTHRRSSAAETTLKVTRKGPRTDQMTSLVTGNSFSEFGLRALQSKKRSKRKFAA